MTAHFSLSYDGTKPSSPGAVIGQLIGLPNRTTSVTQLDVMCPCYVSWLKEDWRWNGIVQARLKMHSMRRKMKHNFQEAFSSRFAFYHNFLTCYLHSRWLFLCTSRESLIKRFFSRRLLLLLCFSFWVGTRSFYFSSSFFCVRMHYRSCNLPPTHFSSSGNSSSIGMSLVGGKNCYEWLKEHFPLYRTIPIARAKKKIYN